MEESLDASLPVDTAMASSRGLQQQQQQQQQQQLLSPAAADSTTPTRSVTPTAAASPRAAAVCRTACLSLSLTSLGTGRSFAAPCLLYPAAMWRPPCCHLFCMLMSAPDCGRIPLYSAVECSRVRAGCSRLFPWQRPRGLWPRLRSLCILNLLLDVLLLCRIIFHGNVLPQWKI
ncbi:uncharacterized protein LOC126427080 [Schistocerca serialis cubense]|uniref:uncharacterized protein LOC126427080 n=1 Tax=Schistocerca serialis cubense TaxID=2023355 RepID=UPI00214E9783|nr:uncharacterized protein LOC126427080 [Schistocerca serialis cubense]